MKPLKTAVGVLLGMFFVSVALGQLGATVPNWTVPSHHGAITTMDDLTTLLPFVGVTPCRIVDTRGPTGPFGGPRLFAGSPRTFDFPAGPCPGLPLDGPSLVAYSVNVTVTNTLGPGFIKIYPQGTTPPLVSTVNYVAGQTIANAAIVVGGVGRGVTVMAGVSGTDLIIDINGYFSASPGGSMPNGFQIEVNNALVPAIHGNNLASLGLGVEGEGNTGVVGLGSVVGVGGAVNSTATYQAGVRGEDQTGYRPVPTVFSTRVGVIGTSTDAVGVMGESRGNAVVGQLRDNLDDPTEYGILGASFGTAGDFTGPPWGVFSGGNLGATGAKHFVEPHPSDPRKVILYSTVEGRTVDTTFRGTARLVDRVAVIEVPEDFRIVTSEEGLTVQVTPVGAWSQIYVESQNLNRIVLRGSRDVDFHYQVTGLRRAFRDFEPVRIGYEFMPGSPDERIPTYLTEEAKRRLILNGTYNPDGTVNMETAERVGWTRIWAERRAAAEAAAKDHATKGFDRSASLR